MYKRNMTPSPGVLSIQGVVTFLCALIVSTDAANTLAMRSATLEAQTATNHAQISGAVMDDTGVPVRGASIYLVSDENRFSATTDAAGRYRLVDVPLGLYSALVDKTGYLSGAYGQRGPYTSGRPLSINALLSNVDFVLWRAGIIVGHVIDEFGDPLAQARVSALSTASGAGGVQLVAAPPAMTDDEGGFRIGGLKPGKYYLVASTPAGAAVAESAGQRLTYAPTYYPGTVDPAGASTVVVKFGPTSDLRIGMMRTPVLEIAGRVINRSGRPVLKGSVSILQRLSSVVTPIRSVPLHPDGTFRAADLPAGTYVLDAIAAPAQGQTDPGFANGDVVAPEGGTADVTLTVQPLIRTRGSVVLPSGLDMSALSGARLFVLAKTVQLSNRGASSNNGFVTKDLTFELAVRPGPVALSVVGIPRGLALESIEVNGRDVTDHDLQVRGVEDIRSIEVKLTNEISEVSGHVTDRSGEAVRGCPILVFPRDQRLWSTNSRRLQAQRADGKGDFVFTGLPGGDYYAIALTDVATEAIADPDYLSLAARKAGRFSLLQQQRISLTLEATALNP